ncbi:MAG TPA: hypothetical protein VG890_08360 [Puia sp.]|nr:hypothetical protein [Puia sp.]
MLKTFLKSKPGQSGAISVEQYNHELKEAETEYERGEFTSHEDFLKLIKKWESGDQRSLDKAIGEANEAGFQLYSPGLTHECFESNQGNCKCGT